MPDTLIEGIDVSSNQGEVDWGTVARAGKAFGFARATIGGHQCDPQFVANWRSLWVAPIVAREKPIACPTSASVRQANHTLYEESVRPPISLPTIYLM